MFKQGYSPSVGTTENTKPPQGGTGEVDRDELKLDLHNLWEKVQMNQKVLASCDRHDFNIPIVNKDNPPMTRKYKCSKCGGEVFSEHKYWYELAIKHMLAKKIDEQNT